MNPTTSYKIDPAKLEKVLARNHIRFDNDLPSGANYREEGSIIPKRSERGYTTRELLVYGGGITGIAALIAAGSIWGPGIYQKFRKSEPAPAPQTPAPKDELAELAEKHSGYDWRYRQKSENLATWYTLQLYKMEFQQGEKHIVGVTMHHSHKGQDKDKFYGAMRFDNKSPKEGEKLWRYALPFGKQVLIEVTKEQYDALKSGKLKPQFMMYKVDDPKKQLDIHASVKRMGVSIADKVARRDAPKPTPTPRPEATPTPT
ncbi:hypothetical protein HYX00_02305 [Candidatus Woesearchaeota archaeon]|nr:hypothetical protein [Candidatus Woesearchaeota archaeon]